MKAAEVSRLQQKWLINEERKLRGLSIADTKREKRELERSEDDVERAGPAKVNGEDLQEGAEGDRERHVDRWNEEPGSRGGAPYVGKGGGCEAARRMGEDLRGGARLRRGRNNLRKELTVSAPPILKKTAFVRAAALVD